MFKLTVRFSSRQPKNNDGHTERQTNKKDFLPNRQTDRQIQLIITPHLRRGIRKL